MYIFNILLNTNAAPMNKVIEYIKTKKLTVLIILGLLIEICFLAFSILQGSGRNIELYIAVYAISFALFFMAYLLLKNVRSYENDSGKPFAGMLFNDKLVRGRS